VKLIYKKVEEGADVNFVFGKVGRCRSTPGCPLVDPGMTALGFIVRT